jgi:hypothetical protein
MIMKQINRKKVNGWWRPVEKSGGQAENLH